MRNLARALERPLPRARRFGAVVLLCALRTLPAQVPSETKTILERLERLEQQNRELMDQIRALREELAASRSSPPSAPAPVASALAASPPLEDRVAVQESRTAELAQTKVEASSRYPVRLSGMVLFNTFFNTLHNGDLEYPVYAAPGYGASAGAALRQTTLGLEYSGPQTIWGGKVRGSVFMDFWGGSGQPLNELMRLRTGVIGVDWEARSFEVGLEKPLISPRDPDSLAQVGISPLAGAGNLWLWIPQARFEQHLRFGEHSGVRLQVAGVETREVKPGAYASYGGPSLSVEYENRRPGVEGRVELFAGSEARRVEIAAGFHRSVSHVAHVSVPSNVFSFDWLARPAAPVDITGAFFTGQNVAHLGTGGIDQGYTLGPWDVVRAVHSRGGWTQLTVRAAPRLSLHLFTGVQEDRNSDLQPGNIGRNLLYGANLFYRLAPNVLVGIEGSQARTSYVGASRLLNNHYDLALAYLF